MNEITMDYVINMLPIKSVLLFCAALLIIVGLFIATKTILEYARGRANFFSFIKYLPVITGIVLLLITGVYNNTFNKNLKIAAENEGYTTYFEGDLVNIDNIDLNQYVIKIDKENKKILLSEKHYYRFGYRGY